MEIKNYYVIPGLPQFNPTPEVIIEATCAEYCVHYDSVKMRSRKRYVTLPRKAIIHLLRTMTNLGWRDIAKRAGYGKDHSSAIHANNTLIGYMSVYPDVRSKIERIKERIKNELQ